MGVRLRGVVVGAVFMATGILASRAQAQEVAEPPARLGIPTIPQVIDRAVTLDDYFKDQSILGDTRFIFGLDYEEADINRAAQRLEALYRDLQQQQADDSPIIRTRDLATPYTTTLLLETEAEDSPFFFESSPEK